MKSNQLLALAAIFALLLAGCSGAPQQAPTTNATGDLTSAPAQVTNPYSIPGGTTSITGSGATFPKPLIDAWAIGFNQEYSTVQVGYNGGGSGKGIGDITNKLVQFAASDAPLSPAEKAAAPGILQFPDTIGPLAIVYNVDGVPDGIKLTGDIVGKIMVGTITKWDDQAIKALNPGVNLPSATIGIVYRSDSSGTTFVFTDYLGKSSPDWAAKMGAPASKKPNWAASTARQVGGQAGNDGVASTVSSTANSIGYVDLAFVQNLGLKAAMLQNPAGKFLAPTTAGAAGAAASVADSLPAADGDWSKISIINAPGDDSYPAASFSYILVYDSLAAYNGKATADQLNGMKAWLFWALHDGQEYSETLGYAPLPAKVVAIGEKALQSIAV